MSALEELRAHLRIEGGDEDAHLDRLIAAATGLCEGFLGQIAIRREIEQVVPAVASWRRLAGHPVVAILAVEGLPAEGAAFALPAGAFAIDIAEDGTGWVRVTAPGIAGQARVTFRAGLAEDWEGLVPAIRQGIVRLAAHLYTHRDGADDGAPPAAIAALWRPWRRLRIASPQVQA